MLESQLQRPLPDDLAEALANGVILCQLANQLRPRSVPFIHVPSPAVVSWGPGQEVGVWAGTPGASFLLPLSFLTHPQPKLSALKSRKNVESFLEACRKMGVPEVWGCALGRRAGLSYKGYSLSWAQRGPLHGCSRGSLLPRRKHSHQPVCPPACLPSRTLHVGVALALHVRAGVGRMVLLLLLTCVLCLVHLSYSPFPG